jgi:hypothetical protein
MKRLFFLVYLFCGVSFWIPSIIIHGIRAYNFGGSRADILAIVFLPVIASIVTLETIDRKRLGDHGRGIVALWMLFGIWFTGPLMMTVAATFSGGGFARPDAWRFVSSAITLFIPYTWVMSTYDGTLGALIIVTIWFIIVAMRRFICRTQLA